MQLMFLYILIYFGITMKLIEQIFEKVALSVGFPRFNGAHCVFDRTTRRASIKRIILFWRLKTIDLPLDEVAFARIVTVSGSAGESGSYEKTYPEIILTSGRRIPLATGSESSAKKTVAAINAFLADGRVASG